MKHRFLEQLRLDARGTLPIEYTIPPCVDPGVSGLAGGTSRVTADGGALGRWLSQTPKYWGESEGGRSWEEHSLLSYKASKKPVLISGLSASWKSAWARPLDTLRW